jgi:hypothetical protein
MGSYMALARDDIISYVQGQASTKGTPAIGSTKLLAHAHRCVELTIKETVLTDGAPQVYVPHSVLMFPPFAHQRIISSLKSQVDSICRKIFY